MRNKKGVWLLCLLIVIVIIGDIALVILNHQKEEIVISSEPNGESYYCYKTEDWNNFNFPGPNGEDLGKYKKDYEYNFTYDSINNSLQGETKVIYTFNSIYGFEALDVDLVEFEEILEKSNLRKTYISKSFSFVNFMAYKNKENSLEEFLNSLHKYGFNCINS